MGHTPALRTAPGSAAVDRPALIRRPEFVGRGKEIAALGDALTGPPRVVIVEGEAGIGKSRLLQEFFATEQGRHRALMVWCPPFRQPHTLGPIADGLRHAVGDVAGLGLSGLAGALRPLFPEWAADLPPTPEPAEDASAARHRVFRALAELLGQLRIGQLVAEDAHWADEATIEFLLYLAARQPQSAGLVVTYRSDEVPADSLLSRLASRAAGASGLRLMLGPLDVDGTAALISSMLAGQQVSGEFAAFMHERTEGVPLAVEESVRLMGERADLTRSGSAWVRRQLADIAVPPTIRDAVLERTGRFGADAQEVLRAAAVLAVPASEEMLAAVSGLAADRASAGLSMAVGRGLLDEDERGLLWFRHMLAARAVYEAIPAPQRRVMHLRAGQALEAASPAPVTQLARHFREARDTAHWCRYAEQAADQAVASGDDATAAALLHDLVVHGGLPAAELARLTKKIPFSTPAGDEYLRDLVGALRSGLAATRLAVRDEARVRFQLARVLMIFDDFEASRTELKRAIPHLADPADSARAMIFLGWPRGVSSPRSAHLRWLWRAGQVPLPPNPAATRLRLAVDRVTALLELGDEAGWAEAARIPADTRCAQERHEIVRLAANLAELAIMWGRYSDAAWQAQRGLALAERHHYLRYRDGIIAARAHLDWFTGTWDGLAGRAAEVARIAEPAVRLDATLITGLLHAATGARAHAADCFTDVLEETLRRGKPYGAMEPAAALARLRLSDGGVAEALEITEKPARIVVGKGIWIWATELAPVRVSALTQAGRAEDGAQLVTAFGRGMRGRNAPAPKASLVMCRAILAEARGERARAATLFGRAAAAWDGLPRPYDALLARERQARCLLAAGRPTAALALLQRVLDGLNALGARGDTPRLTETLRQHLADGKRTGPGRPSHGGQLSPRELDVARLLVRGGTNRDIAQQLFLSPKTVAHHVESAMRKLGAGSRTALAVRLVEANIVARDQDLIAP